MVGHPARAHGLEFRLHGGIGRGRNNGEFLAETEGVSHGPKLAASRAESQQRCRHHSFEIVGWAKRAAHGRPAWAKSLARHKGVLTPVFAGYGPRGEL